ncbi:bifunctional 2-polyprenyl-6-hydroxyphenol methylase/3-demethylubiquinol 3-O-methyltransferase UbiG [Halovivax sp.]|uniref:class I SAM-dependent methyltransferase n=1 Tax=Halovivax sp. TaxID=1935978 RepID=UPI0025C21A3C|nr:methyltransferase domain-containing protein [Halovivax sp.]
MDSNEVRREWAERSGEYSPAYYAYYGADDRSESVRAILERFVDREATVLELGCSSGRHLSHLSEHGFENLAGIELNGDAFEVMAETYPELAARGTFYHDAIEAVVDDFEDGQFDAVYSVETLQHVHPDAEWVFAELGRITDDLLITVENEGEDAPDGGVAGTMDEGGNERAAQSGGDGGNERASLSGGDGGNARAAQSGGEPGRPSPTEPAVTYVDDDVPLYHRDWNRVFTEVGLVEVDAREGERDTVRAFRSRKIGPSADRGG